MQKRSLETRTRILNAALDCFAQTGYEASSVAEICQAAGVSKGAFYHHFPSKQALFLALLESWLETIDSMMEINRRTAPSSAQALRQMSELMTHVFAQAGGRLPMFLEFWTQASHDPQIWQAVVQPYQRYQDYFSELIQAGITEGSFKPVDVDATARMLVSLALGLLLQGLLDPQGTDWDRVTRQSVELFLSGLKK